MSKPDNGLTRQLLPLNAIRVFVEAARQLNFSRAGRVLGMTQGSVSRHVATLEHFLGRSLFARTGTSVSLTDAGRLYFDTVQQAMSTIELATRQIVYSPSNARLLIVRTSLPTFAMTTLIPALPHFHSVDCVSVDLITSLSRPSPSDIYAVLISRDLTLTRAEQWLLSTENLVCVAAPTRCLELAAQPIDRWQFLAAQSRLDALATWSNHLGLKPDSVHVIASFDHCFMAIAAAMGGNGASGSSSACCSSRLRQLLGLHQSAYRRTRSS